jgi:HEAT repeat protein
MKLATAISMLCLLSFCLGCGPKGPPQYGGKTLRYWETQAAGDSYEARRVAAKALGEIGPRGLPALARLLADPDHRVQAAANLAVAGMRQKAVTPLKEMLGDPDPKVRAGAAKALMQILVDTGRKDAVPQLIQFLRHPDPNVRASAAKALLQTGPEAKAAIPALKEALQDENPGVRHVVNSTLKIVGGGGQSSNKQYVPPHSQR